MPSSITNYRVVVASPSDVSEEREIVSQVVDKLKEEFKNDNVTLSLYRWESDANPSFHTLGGQALIDEVLKIDQSDIFIGIFFKKAGTPVFNSNSGTEHELNQAIESWKISETPDIKLYFKKALLSIDDLKDNEIDEYKKIRDLKKSLFQYGIIQEFATIDEFEELIEKHLRNYLKKKLFGNTLIRESNLVEDEESKSDIYKLIEIYRQEEKQIDYKSNKEQLSRVDGLKNKIYNEIFQPFEEKKYALTNVLNEIPKLLFEKILLEETLNSDTLKDIYEIRHNTTKFQWYDRCLIVSALTLSILKYRSFDSKKIHLLIDFTLDKENEVWQRSLVGLVFGLIKNQNKYSRFTDLIPRLKGLQSNISVQLGINSIEIILRERLYLNSILFKNFYEFEYFKNDISNCFIPFYDQNPVILKALERVDFEFDSDSFTKFITNAPIMNSHKYAICLSENLGVKKNIEDRRASKRTISILNRTLDLADFFYPYQTIICEFYHFFKNFPQYAFDDFFSKKVLIGKSKLKDIILSKVQELKISAKSYIEEKEYRSALLKLESLLEVEPNDLEGLWHTGQCYISIYNPSKALEYFLRFNSVKKDSVVSLNIAWCYSQKNNLEMQLQYLKVAEELNPNHIEVILSFVKYYDYIGDAETVEVYFKKGFELQPENEDLKYAYAIFQLNHYYNYEFVDNYFDDVIPKTKNEDIIESYAIHLFRNKKMPEEADKYFRRAISIDNDIQIKATYGLFLVEGKVNVEEGERILKRTINKYSNLPQVVLAYLHYIGRLKKDIHEYQRIKEHILKNFSEIHILLTNLANFEREFYGPTDKVIEIFNKSVNLNPYYSYTYSLLAYTYLERNEYDKAEEFWRLSYKFDMHNVIETTNLAAILFINNKYEEACGFLEEGFKQVKEGNLPAKLDLLFLSYAHLKDECKVAHAKKEINRLIDLGITTDSNMEHNFEAAIKNSHKDEEFLLSLKSKICTEAYKLSYLR